MSSHRLDYDRLTEMKQNLPTIDIDLVHKLVSAQFPQFKGLPMKFIFMVSLTMSEIYQKKQQ